MAGSRSAQVRRVGGAFQALAALCLLLGALIGWVAPRADWEFMAALGAPVAGSGVDSNTFLGAALTTLGVIVAILIGYNVAGLQTAGQLMSLALARAMLLSLAPFLLCWTATTGVGLIYLLAPPRYMGQLWQMLLWFAAVVLFMLGYLWMLPWRLSGEYAARWAVDDLRNMPIEDWEAQDGYAVAQSSIAAATTRGDLGTVSAIAQTLGAFLVTARDQRAERDNRYHRGRYRALKNLVTGCAQFAGAAPTAVSYQLGYLAMGALLRAVAIGLPTDDPETDLFTGLLRAIGESPDRIDSFWTGARHALCRRDGHAAPYLLRYWRLYPAWNADEPRAAPRVADGVMRLHGELMQRLARVEDVAAAQDEAARMLADLYRALGDHLPRPIESEHGEAERERLLGLAAALLHALQRRAQALSAIWSDEQRTVAASAYDHALASFTDATDAPAEVARGAEIKQPAD